MLTEDKMADALANWRTMTDAVKTSSEEDLKQLLDYEKANNERALFLNKIYGRYSRLRAARERRELFNQ